MIYFMMPSQKAFHNQMTALMDDPTAPREVMIVKYSPASLLLPHKKFYQNFYSQGTKDGTHPYMLFGCEIKYVSVLTYAKWRVKCLLAWLYGYGFYAKP